MRIETVWSAVFVLVEEQDWNLVLLFLLQYFFLQAVCLPKLLLSPVTCHIVAVGY